MACSYILVSYYTEFDWLIYFLCKFWYLFRMAQVDEALGYYIVFDCEISTRKQAQILVQSFVVIFASYVSLLFCKLEQ